MTDTREHSELALSASDRWVSCPGSIFLIRNIEVPPPGPEAKRGTHVHELCSTALTDFLQHKVDGTDPEIRFSLMSANYEAEEIDNARAYVQNIWKEILNQSVTNKAWGVEERFTLDDNLKIFGTVDFWCIFIDDRAKRAACVIDYKNGFNYVSEKSGQLKSYAVALRKEIRAAGKDIDYVITGVFQPRCVSAAVFRCASHTAKQLDAWEKKVYKAAHQIYVKKRPTFKVGSYCRWCPAQAICKAYSKSIETETALRVANPDELVLPAPETIPDEQLAKIILNGKRLEEFVKACNVYALNKHLSGRKLPGLKAVLGTQRRKWKEDEDLIAQSLRGLGLREDDVYQKPKLNTITAVERKLGKGKLDDLTEISEAKPVLVPLTDARVEIQDGLALLSDVETEET